MYTGIIQKIGEILEVSGNNQGKYLKIAYNSSQINLIQGDSISCNGICLTIVEINKNEILAFLSSETLQITTASTWNKTTKLNIEQSLRLGDSVDGHFVYGHIDEIATILNISKAGDSMLVELSISTNLLSFIAPKSSIAIDGVSLTINSIDESSFRVMIIPYTYANTCFSIYKINTKVNLEVDMLARYVKRQFDLINNNE